MGCVWAYLKTNFGPFCKEISDGLQDRVKKHGCKDHRYRFDRIYMKPDTYICESLLLPSEAVLPTRLPPHLSLNYLGPNHTSTFEHIGLYSPPPPNDVPGPVVSREHIKGLSTAKPRLSSSSSPAFMKRESGCGAENKQCLMIRESELR
jgi:hypothetical protein